MEAKVELLTIERAKYYISLNKNNRKVSKAKDFYSQQMRDGYWKENGESIIIDTEGFIKDGQHRLLSVIETGHEYNAVIVTGVDVDVMSTIDTGKSRSLQDMLELNGFMYSTQTASIIKNILKFKNYNSKVLSPTKDGNSKPKTSNSEGLEYGLKWQVQLLQLVRKSERIYVKQSTQVFSIREIAFMIFLLAQYGYKDIHKQFVETICGINTTQGSGSGWFYNKCLTAKINGDRISGDWKMSAFVRVWNNFVEGDVPLNHMKINTKEDIIILKYLYEEEAAQA